mmetsp:Transcript_4459/g.6743  ORF Transcript_4459/g.6743 Transcript_4459/m.6743 type:complete len:414 (+) Transcript_4459:116-1357(+)
MMKMKLAGNFFLVPFRKESILFLRATSSDFGALAILSTCVSVAHISEKKFIWTKRLGAPVISMCLAAAMAQNVTPFIRSACWDFALPASLVLSLIGTWQYKMNNNSNFVRVGIAFGFGTIASILGSAFTCFCLSGIGTDNEALATGAAAICASYIGGTANFFAVANALDTPISLTTALATADIVVMAAYFTLLGLVGNTSRSEGVQISQIKMPRIIPSLICICLASIIVFFSSLLHTAGARTALLALFAALVGRFVTNNIRLASAPLAAIALLYFYAGLGSCVTPAIFAKSGPQALVLASIALIGHLLFLAFPILLWRYFSFRRARQVLHKNKNRQMIPSLIETLVASNACIGGPSTAAAFAIASGRSDLAVSAVLWGTIGYALATSLGITIYPSFRFITSLLGGTSSSSSIF